MLNDFNNFRRVQRFQYLKMMHWKRKKFYNNGYLKGGSSAGGHHSGLA